MTKLPMTQPAATHQRGPLKFVMYAFTSTVFWVLGKLLYRLRTEGRHLVPMRGPVVVVANHLSQFDPPFIGGATRRQLSYMARDTLFQGPFGWLIRLYDAVPVNRDGSGIAGIRAMLRRLKQGGALVLFPEGTRSADGQLQPLLPGFIALVRRSGAVLVPISFDGPFEVWPKGTKWPRLFGRVAMHYGDPITPEAIAELSDEELLELVRVRLVEFIAAEKRFNSLYFVFSDKPFFF